MNRNPITGTSDPKSARYQFNWELPDNNTVRQNNGRIPGGKKASKGGACLIKGGTQVVSRSETYDTNEAIKPMSGAGLFSAIGDAVDGVTGLLGLGKQKGGRKPKVNKLTKKEMEHLIKISEKQKKIRGGMIAPLNTEYPLDGVDTEIEGAGIFGDIGSAVDSVGSLFGLGKTKGRKTCKGGMNSNMDDVQQVKDQMDLLEGGIKNLRKLMSKIK